MFTLSIPRVRSVSWIVEKVLKFAQQFSRHGKCWKIEGKSWKNGKSLLFLKGTTCPSQVKFFSCLSNLIQSRLYVMEKAFFLRFFKFSVDHLFDKLMFFAKKSGWSLEFWIKICTNPVCRIPTRKGIWYSMDTSPISDSPFIRIDAARRSFASLQKSSRNHRSYLWTEALSDRAIFVWPWKMVSVSVRYLFHQPMDEKIKT